MWECSIFIIIIGALVPMALLPHEARTVGCGGGASKQAEDLEKLGLLFLFLSFLVNSFYDPRSIVLGFPSLLLSFLVTFHSTPALCNTIYWTCRGSCQIMCTGASITHAVCEIIWADYKHA